MVMIGEREKGILGTESKGKEREKPLRNRMFTEASTLDS